MTASGETTSSPPSLLYLWDKRTLYIGPLFEPIVVNHAASTLVISLSGDPIKLYTDTAQPLESQSILFPAGSSVSVDTGSAVVVNCHLDVLGYDYDQILLQMQQRFGDVGLGLRSPGRFVDTFQALLNLAPPSCEAYGIVDELLTNPHGGKLSTFVADPRIARVVDLIKQSIHQNLSVEALASEVNLSVPRLVQLFKQQTGIPIRRYRLWHRLYVTAVKVGEGESLTAAAINAGFSDSSHFTHTFRTILGMKPSLLLGQPNRMRVIPPESLRDDLVRENY
ncbi:MAG: AraC family transcriptional regulator [Pseudomonadales bacterium]|uniref:AraC family transcriptional regulator n=1 Tax=Oleiphilus messinensis TaxID=141451 RepID=A0A1Y0IDI9_9GAMM|nr:AraC family transcriptional regulator [Oleiphilus messinensis]ARU58501.1 AraC family transcriptional regulator [Oleiphilus messinensis]MCG8611307.1 AraC family transcriptional regulator [Pseudomonadales bacterium]